MVAQIKKRDELIAGYKKRIASFMVDMLEKPLVHNDEYAYVQERQIK